ncbi:hypothetical protein ACIZ62_15520 [Acetobacterium carbinolicum]|uniref:hypothetical protein n=1 Tax=Acetobacterium TaxID=33951 RepID=UPI000DBEBE75|nr:MULTISPECIES: hypothetical protein [unclassified Acetobacterium]AWW27857.1 hypothetical protein DOZ58_15125 [Acetobacterium sp. KB-1]MDZ5725775.1 hypothetical protein [Acetobacterium sp. K1/6]
MGRQFMARCNQCQTEFEVREGGGLDFYLLHCDTCGEEKVIRQEEVLEKIKKQDPAFSFNEKVEAIAGRCHDGHYRIKAKARCPNCQSDDYSAVTDANGEIRMTFYD